MEREEMVGIYEIAAMASVSPSAVINWRRRFEREFPPPVAELHSGPVFLAAQVRKWLQKRRGSMATILAVINLKGGVGKSTTTVALAEFLAFEFSKKVLVIDLDAQTNATVMLIGEKKWKTLNEQKATLAQMFKDALTDDPEQREFRLDDALQTSVSNVRQVRNLDLLPSSIDLIDIQDSLGRMSSGRFYADNPTDILRKALRRTTDSYDYVLIDCPPNLGIITLNGLRIADGYIIPTIPDILSTYGIPQIRTRVAAFAENVGEEIKPLGIVISKFDSRSTVHNTMEKRLRAETDKLGPVFKTVIPQRNQIAASAEFAPVSTLRQKYGYQGQWDEYVALTREVMGAAEA